MATIDLGWFMCCSSNEKDMDMQTNAPGEKEEEEDDDDDAPAERVEPVPLESVNAEPYAPARGALTRTKT